MTKEQMAEESAIKFFPLNNIAPEVLRRKGSYKLGFLNGFDVAQSENESNIRAAVEMLKEKVEIITTLKDRLAMASVAFQEIKTEVKDCLTPSNLIAIEVDRIASEYLKSLEDE